MVSSTVHPHEELLIEYSFYENVDKSLIKIACDIVDVMYSIYNFDISVVPNNEQPRIATLLIPVSDKTLWEPTRETLEELINWVSEDRITIKFSEVSKKEYSNNLLSVDIQLKEIVTLFSGGLDSFAGASHNFENQLNSDYTGFVNNVKEGKIQSELRSFYATAFPNSSIHIIKKQRLKKEYFTQSTRSLLYLSLAVSKSISVNANQVFIYENGILTLNPELSGRYTTKTTHPRTIYLFNELLKKLGVSLTIKNPFTLKTKGEILVNLNEEFKSQIRHTYTCGKSNRSPHQNHKGQCGICIPCLLRKISIASQELESYDVQYHYKYGVQLNEIKELSYKKEYQLNIDYFIEYVECILDKTIMNHIDIKGKYYDDEEYYDKLLLMFDKFTKEFERYWSKYGIY